MLDVLWIDTAYAWFLDLVHGFIDLSDRRREGIKVMNPQNFGSNLVDIRIWKSGFEWWISFG